MGKWQNILYYIFDELFNEKKQSYQTFRFTDIRFSWVILVFESQESFR